MKIFNKNSIKIILISFLSYSCAAIPANKVKLDDYPKLNKEDIKGLNLKYNYDETHAGLTKDTYSDYYEYIKKNNSDRKYDDYLFFNYFENERYALISKSDNVSDIFNYNIVFNLKSKYSSIEKLEFGDFNGCVVKISSKKDLGFCPITNLIAPLTLAIFPYYCQHTYEAKATLISYPTQSQLKGKAINIKSNQAGAKEGDYFLDENDRLVKLLKTYELKDKVHEVWSSLWMLSWFIYNPKSVGSPEGAKDLTENTISEALTRSIINDALKFEECKKR